MTTTQTIIAFIKMMVNNSEPMTAQEQEDFLDTTHELLKARDDKTTPEI